MENKGAKMKTYYLEEYLNTINGLPDDLKKNFDKMLKLEQRNNDITNEIDTNSKEYLRKVKERHLNPRKRKSEMEKIMKMFGESKENSDLKVNMAMQTYEMVDRHIRKLDADLARFEAEMKEAGGRLSQTESEGEETDRGEKKVMKKKKGRPAKEEATRPKTPLAASTNGKDLNVSDPAVPIVDMPVDPNEPTYCLCQQVSYGEMIGCDNQVHPTQTNMLFTSFRNSFNSTYLQDCPIEWFHFPCMALESKPRGKWYCPKCLPMFKKQK